MPRVRIRGLRESVRAIEELARAGGEELVQGVRVLGEQIMTDVKTTRPGAGVPRDEGILAGSGTVDGPDQTGKVDLSFGGAAAPYALRQHEDLTLRHTIGEARYLIRGLERAVNAGKPIDILRAQADEAMQRARRAYGAG
jgi:hypothetical protein